MMLHTHTKHARESQQLTRSGEARACCATNALPVAAVGQGAAAPARGRGGAGKCVVFVIALELLVGRKWILG